MRIGIVCYPTFGGSGVVAAELGKWLADKGHEIHFITYSHPARLERYRENIFFHEVNVSHYPLFEYPPYESALAGKIVSAARVHRLDLLHVHYAIPHASCAYFAQQILSDMGKSGAAGACPFITTLHGTDINLIGKDPAYESVVVFSLNHSDGITAVSRSLQRETYSHFPLKKEISVIPNFIDTYRFKRTYNERDKQAIAHANEKIIIHTSNFRPLKNVGHTISVLKEVIKKIPAKLFLIGDGPERGIIEQRVFTEKLSEHVTFFGNMHAVESLLSYSDVFLLPSASESFGLSALEAMACGVPVVSTNVGGLPELNLHGKTGYMCRADDIETMTEYTLELLTDEKKRKEFSGNAVQQSRNFSMEKIAPLYEEYYRKVIGEYRKR